MRRLSLLVGCLVLAALPADAAAVSEHAPPGNSGIDEYVESIPEIGGDRPTQHIPSEGGAARLSRRARRALAAYGSAGSAAANLAGATAPAKRRPGPREARRAGDAGSQPASALRRAVTGSGQGGMGIALPIILVLTALVAGWVALARRRRAGEGQRDRERSA
jgi:hypothetical protein